MVTSFGSQLTKGYSQMGFLLSVRCKLSSDITYHIMGEWNEEIDKIEVLSLSMRLSRMKGDMCLATQRQRGATWGRSDRNCATAFILLR